MPVAREIQCSVTSDLNREADVQVYNNSNRLRDLQNTPKIILIVTGAL